MPFKSCDQERALFVKDPELAKSWVRKYGSLCKGKKSDSEMKAKHDRARKT